MPNFKQRSTILVLATGAILYPSFLPLAVWAQSVDFTSKALSAYKKRDFSSAVRYFVSAVAQEPKNQLLHYYLANSLTLSGQYGVARLEYQLAYDLNPSGLIASYCQQAMTQYRSIRSSANTVAPNFASEARIKEAKTKIVQQGQDVADKRYASGMASAGQRRDLGQRQVETIGDAGDRLLEDMRNTRVGAPGLSIPAFSPGEIEAVRRNYEAQEEQAKQAAEYSARWHQMSARKHSKDIQDSAAGLASQLSPAKNGFSLVPEGTNLYIRTFASSPSSAAHAIQEELLATPEKLILDPHFRPGKSTGHILPVPFAAKPGSLPAGNKSDQSINADLKVHGELLNGR